LEKDILGKITWVIVQVMLEISLGWYQLGSVNVKLSMSNPGPVLMVGLLIAYMMSYQVIWIH